MALEGGEWSAAWPGRILPPRKTRYPFYRRLGGPQGWSGWAKNLLPTGIWSWTVQPVVSHYTDWATWPTLYNVQGAKYSRTPMFDLSGGQVFCSLNWCAQIFQKSRSHLKILSVRRVTWKKFHIEGPRRHRTKFSYLSNLAHLICLPAVNWEES